MKQSIIFTYKESSRIEEKVLESLAQKYSNNIQKYQHLAANPLSPYSFIKQPLDEQVILQIQQRAQSLSNRQPAAILIIGIGGSYAGAKAVFDALKSANKLVNSLPLVYWLDTFDMQLIPVIEQKIRALLQDNQTVLLTIISKSGTTLETVALGAIFINLLQYYYPTNYPDFITIITNTDSALHTEARQQKYTALEISSSVAGRFSIFTAAGLFPLALLGVDIIELCAGAANMLDSLLSKDIQHNSALVSAVYLYHYYQQGINIHDMFVWQPCLESFGKWYRQLLAESIGKTIIQEEKKMLVGITPTVSVGTTDLHSATQLALAGPLDKCTTFVEVERLPNDVEIPAVDFFGTIAPYVAHKKMSNCLQIIIAAVKKSYESAQRPFVTIQLPQLSEYYLGQLLQMKMMEIVFLAEMVGVNAFDQPAVEQYKEDARDHLKND